MEIVGSNPIEDALEKTRSPKLEMESVVLVEQRSARDPATVEIVGSNPTGDSLLKIRNPKSEELRHGTRTGIAAELKPR